MPKNWESPDLMKDKRGYLTMEEVDQLLNSIPDRRDHLFILLLAKTGRRLSEVLELKPKHIQGGRSLVEWRILKKGKRSKGYKHLSKEEKKQEDHERIVTKLKAIDRFTLNTLQGYIKYKEIGHNQYVFNSSGELGRLTRQWGYWKFKKLIKEHLNYEKIGNQKPHPHVMRHTFAIDYLNRSTESKALTMLQKHLDHANLNMTGFYTQFDQSEQIEMINRLHGGKDYDRWKPKEGRK